MFENGHISMFFSVGEAFQTTIFGNGLLAVLRLCKRSTVISNS